MTSIRESVQRSLVGDGVVQEDEIAIKMQDGSLAWAKLIPFYRDDTLVSYELRLFVPQKYRKQGIGRTLLAEALTVADSKDMVVWLRPVADDEDDITQLTSVVLREWFAKHGFVSRGVVLRRPAIKERMAQIAAEREAMEAAASMNIQRGDDDDDDVDDDDADDDDDISDDYNNDITDVSDDDDTDDGDDDEQEQEQEHAASMGIQQGDDVEEDDNEDDIGNDEAPHTDGKEADAEGSANKRTE